MKMSGTDHIAQIVNVNMKWKVSMAVSSNDVRNLQVPMVTLMLITTDKKGQKQYIPVEMTLAKFKEFKATMSEVHSHMEQLHLL